METKELINITDERGIAKQVQVVAYFNLKSNGKNYLIYTENKTDQNGNIEVNTSEVVMNQDGSIILEGISEDDVWVEIKKVMLDIAKDGE